MEWWYKPGRHPYPSAGLGKLWTDKHMAYHDLASHSYSVKKKKDKKVI